MASGTTVPSYGAIQYPETYSIVIHGTLTQQYWWPNNEHDTNLRIPSQPSGPSHYLLFGFIFMAERGTTTCPSLGNIRHTSIFDHFLTKSTHKSVLFFLWSSYHHNRHIGGKKLHMHNIYYIRFSQWSGQPEEDSTVANCGVRICILVQLFGE